MKRHQTLLAGLAVVALSAGAAAADCAQEIDALGAAGGSISKDGTLAPLEDGGEGDDASAIATSPQDVQAQQEGGETAAETAEAQAAPEGAGDREAAIERARAALAAGDEAGCMAAVEEARSL